MIQDEYSDRKDLSNQRKYHLRNKEKRTEEQRQRRKANPKKYNSLARKSMRKARLKSLGLTIENYNDILLKQKNVCGICKQHNTSKRDWYIDHCHKTGKVRGLLCNNCNLMLGHAFDNKDTLLNAVSYLNDK